MNFEFILTTLEEAWNSFSDEEKASDTEALFLGVIVAELRSVDASIPSMYEESEELKLQNACSRIPGLLYLVGLY